MNIYVLCIYIYIYMYCRITHVITSRKVGLKQTWRLTKAMTKMKPDTEQMTKLE